MYSFKINSFCLYFFLLTIFLSLFLSEFFTLSSSHIYFLKVRGTTTSLYLHSLSSDVGTIAMNESGEPWHCDHFVVLKKAFFRAVLGTLIRWHSSFHLKFSASDQDLWHLWYHLCTFLISFTEHWHGSLRGYTSSSNINIFKSTKAIMFCFRCEYFTIAFGSAVRSYNIISLVSV